MNKTAKRVLAIIGIVILLGIYIATFVVGVFGNGDTSGWLLACIFATVAVPFFMWAIQFIYKKFSKDETNMVQKQKDLEAEHFRKVKEQVDAQSKK